MNKIVVDGSIGEGGGQIFRTSLTLSLLTGKSLQIHNIRANRSSPGLRQQHLTALKAASEISNAHVEGGIIGSQEVFFDPGEIKPGKYRFNISTAGSTSLVFQTIFIPLSVASKDSRITISGGTHVPWSPPFHYLDWQWLSWLKRIGYQGKLTLNRCGYYPTGGGEVSCLIKPGGSIKPIQITERGKLIQIRGISGATNLPRDIPNRQRMRFVSRMGSKYPLNDIRSVILPGNGKGSFLTVQVEFEKTSACFTALGEKKKRSEEVADEVVSMVDQFMNNLGCVDSYLPDQLLIPLCFVDGQSVIHTTKITRHLLTNAEVIQMFISTRIVIDGDLEKPGIVRINP
jgi:RNA 3'-terminal phosphate cyclase (ATP)